MPQNAKTIDLQINARLAQFMPNWTIHTQKAIHVTFVLFDQFSNHVFANALEPMRAANTFLNRKAYNWSIATLDGKNVSSSADLSVAPDQTFGGLSRGDILILLPGYDFQRLSTPALDRRLRAAATRFDTLIGIDTGAWLLASAGLLDGRPATIHHDEFDTFAEAFPDVHARRERWIDDNDRVTTGGAVTAFELMTHLISRTHGTALTLQISALFAVPDTTFPRPMEPPKGDIRVRRALAAMEENIEDPWPLPDIARTAGCRQKELEKRFMAAFGATPQRVYQRIRLNAAYKMVKNTTMSVAEIAARTGYRDSAAFTRAFKTTFETTPRALRAY